MHLNSRHTEKGYHPGNALTLIRSGKDYFDLARKLIAEAEESIHLQTYIFEDDETGHGILQALAAAVARKVKVYLLVDGYASMHLKPELVLLIQQAGIHFRFFEPLFQSSWFYFGRRMHHKILVTDSRHAVIGGINISDHYNDLPGKPAWFDFSIHAEGPIAKELCILCWKTWNRFRRQMPAAPCTNKNFIFPGIENPQGLVRIRRNDWVRGRNEISASYVEMFRRATSHITIICSYFLPGRIIRKFMRQAAKRGVQIRVITTGRSDVALSKPAERWFYDWLLRNGIALYEYQPSILHAKIAICDGQWFTIGSYNLNDISAYASVELNMDVRDEALTASTEQMIHTVIETHCIPVTRETHELHRSPFIQLGRWLSYLLIRFLFRATTFYYRRKRHTHT